MFEKITVGFDGMGGGYDALALARALSPQDGKIAVVHSFHYDLGPLGAPDDASGTAVVEKVSEAVDAATGGDSRCEVVGVSDLFAAPAIQRHAEDSGADLIVVGSCHLGAVGRLLLGDVSRATLTDAPCPVALAPRGFREQHPAIATVGVGFNGTPEAKQALDLAAAFAQEHGAKLDVVSAITTVVPVSPFLTYSADWGELADEQQEAAEAELKGATAGLPPETRTEIVRMTAERALTQLSERVDLLVLGSRGWGMLKRVALGSASDRLIHHATSPLIVVPRPGEHRQVVGLREVASA